MWVVQFHDISYYCRLLQKVGLSKDGIGEEDFINKMKQFVKCQTQYLGILYLCCHFSITLYFVNLFRRK